MAAIDIGSNSVRCLVVNIIPTPEYTHYKKVSMTRLPVRLGQDVFVNGKVGKEVGGRLLDAMRAFEAIMRVNGVMHYRACATSAMREARNGERWLKKIRKRTGIDLELINGKEEARLLLKAKLFDKIQPSADNLLFIDVGGGSTELSFYRDGEFHTSRSFKIGSVRLMNAADVEKEWQEMEAWIAKHRAEIPGDLEMVGSGGNINRIHKHSRQAVSEPLTLSYLNKQYKALKLMSQGDMVLNLDFNIDRADVVVHALKIYRRAMRWADVTTIYVPRIGVSDGIIRDLYHRELRDIYES